MKIIIVTLGSVGDIKPFIWMGRVLSKVGQHLVFLTNPYYEKQITTEGFEFHPIGTIDDYYIAITPPVTTGNKFKDKAEGVKAVKRLFNYLYLKPSKDIYDIVTRLKTPDTIILNHFCVYGAKIAAEKLNIKNININLSPYCLRPFKAVDSFSALIENRMVKVIYNFFDNQLIKKTINNIREELGLKPLKKNSAEWMFEGINWYLFPNWLLNFKLSNDLNTNFVGFPESLKGENNLPDNIMDFFKTHEKPILFTPGTAFQDNKNFFSEAVITLEKMSKPGIFLTKFKDALPEKLPENIIHAEYLPLEHLLDKCCAIVHHGGIGTCYEALKAGIPQLICYRIDEQKGNSHAIKALGVSNELTFKRVSSKLLLEGLEIIHNNDVLIKCNEISKKLHVERTEINLLMYFEKVQAI
ncbi:glycosyltransferase [Pseudobacteroides cellulosolvens]|uniref:UDP-glucuronosyl/UDP-glucosyltransferase n=1 Tax=Pseudobacteroides cellulosolvens ATCC 35603 = DSM 2933 TaxID=398512 RepID=A0A0L6JU36_9FIRM|nr:glycosyltransferase [Pseudobacteroides cellulosolvens]KNY29219.1 UDP-glucuronosyl/UDP-glucosyltransferase [Pseudobacteroides cellulosolvens ATCC 35603 = DSM 2933]